eukprot:TRINITY_DN3075_c0_g1_i1.p1 TRINITY_DN3075_c0_g1~~TRINITY_DN3075_c0_g1_i1.p1  ORF type:complete len:1687 (-),score=242.57 TRINITY_DN3075_c0_g1_i1:145-5205(-)
MRSCPSRARGPSTVVLALLLYTIPLIQASIRADFEDQVNCLDCKMATSTVTRTRAGGFTVSPDQAEHGRTLVGHSRGVVFGKDARFHEPGVQLSFQGDVLLKDHTLSHDYSAVTGSSGESILITGRVRNGELLKAPKPDPGFADTLRHNDTFTWQQVMGDWAFTGNGLHTPGSVQSNVIWIGPRSSWQDYRVTAKVTLESSSGNAGILFQASSQDPVNFGGQQYYAGLDAASGQVVLSRYNSGSESVKASMSIGVKFGHEYTLSVLVREGSITVKVDGRTELVHKEATTYSGSIGLRSSFVGALFSSIVVTSPQDSAQIEGWSAGPSQMVLAWPGFESLANPVLSVQHTGVTPACQTKMSSLFAIVDCPAPLLIAHDASVNFDFALSGGHMSQSSLGCAFMSSTGPRIEGSRDRNSPYNLEMRVDSRDPRKEDGLSFYSVVVDGETQSTSYTGESLNFTVPSTPGTYPVHAQYVTPVCTGAHTDCVVTVVPPISVRSYKTDGGNSLILEWNTFPNINGFFPSRHVIMIAELDDQGNTIRTESSDAGGNGPFVYHYNGVYSGARYTVWVDAQYSGSQSRAYAVSQPLSIWLPPSYNICPHKAGMGGSGVPNDVSNLPEALWWLQPESGIIDHSSTDVTICPGLTIQPPGPLANDKKEYAGVRMYGRTNGGLAINGTYSIGSNANMTLVLTFKPIGGAALERPLLLSESGLITIGRPSGCPARIRYEDTPGSFVCGSGTPTVLWDAWNVLEIHHMEGGRHYVYLNGFLSHNTSTFSWFTSDGVLIGTHADASYSLSGQGFQGEIGEFYIYNEPGDDAEANVVDAPNPTWITTSFQPLLQNSPALWYSPPDDLDARYDVGGIHKNQLYDAPIFSAELVILRSLLQDNGVMLAGHNFRGDPIFVQTPGAPSDMLVFQRHWWIEGQNLNAAGALTVQMFTSRNWFSENTEVRLLTRANKHVPWTDTGSNPTYRSASGTATSVETAVIAEFTLPSGATTYAGYYTFAIRLGATQPGEGIYLESVPWRGRASKTHGRGSVFHFDSQSLASSDTRRELDGIFCVTSWSPLITDSQPNIQGLMVSVADDFFFSRQSGSLGNLGVGHWGGAISIMSGGFAPADAPNPALTFAYTSPGGGLAEEILICRDSNAEVLRIEMGGPCRINVTTATESVCSGSALNTQETHVYTIVDEASTKLYQDTGFMVSASSQMLKQCNFSLSSTTVDITGPLQGKLGDMIWTQGLDDSTVVSHNLAIKYHLPFVGFTPPSTQFRHGAASLYRGGNSFVRSSAYSYELSMFDIDYLTSSNRWANLAADYGADSNHTQLTRADLDQDGPRGVVMRLARSWFTSFSTLPTNKRIRLQVDVTHLDCDNCQFQLLSRNTMNEQFNVLPGVTSLDTSIPGMVSAEFLVTDLQNKIITVGLTCGSCASRTPFDLWCDRRRITAGFEHGLAFFEHSAGVDGQVTAHPPRMVRPQDLGSDMQLLDSKSNLGSHSLSLTDPSHMLSAPPSAINPNPRVNPQWTLIFSASFDNLGSSPQTVVSAGLDVDNSLLGQVNNSRWHCTSTGGNNIAHTSQNLNQGEWYLLGCSYDHYDSGRMTAIYDGSYQGSVNLPLTPQLPFLEHGGLDFNTRLPRYNQAIQEAGDVVIDNVMFFPRLLLQDELQAVADMLKEGQGQGGPQGGGPDDDDDGAGPGLDIDV